MTEKNFRDIIVNSNSSYRFLGAEEGCWLGVDEYGKECEYNIAEMPQDYKDNCIKYLSKHEENIKRGFFLEGVNFKKEEYEDLVQLGCAAMKQKIWELKHM